MSANPSRRRRLLLPLRRRILPALLLGLTLPLLTACGAGFDAATNITQESGDGVMVVSGDITVLNALVVSAPEGNDQSVISLTVANNGDAEEQLTGITSDSGDVELTGDARVPPNGTLQLGVGDTAPATALINGLDKTPGESVRLTLQLSESGSVDVETYVYAPEGEYAEVTAPPQS